MASKFRIGKGTVFQCVAALLLFPVWIPIDEFLMRLTPNAVVMFLGMKDGSREIWQEIFQLYRMSITWVLPSFIITFLVIKGLCMLFSHLRQKVKMREVSK